MGRPLPDKIMQAIRTGLQMHESGCSASDSELNTERLQRARSYSCDHMPDDSWVNDVVSWCSVKYPSGLVYIDLSKKKCSSLETCTLCLGVSDTQDLMWWKEEQSIRLSQKKLALKIVAMDCISLSDSVTVNVTVSETEENSSEETETKEIEIEKTETEDKSEAILRATRQVLFRPGINDTTNGPVLVDNKSAALLEQYFSRYGRESVVDYCHSSLQASESANPKKSGEAAGWMKVYVEPCLLSDVVEISEWRGEKNLKCEYLVRAEYSWVPGVLEDILAKKWRYTSPVVFCEPETDRLAGIFNGALTNNPATIFQDPLSLSSVGTKNEEADMLKLLEILGVKTEQEATEKLADLYEAKSAQQKELQNVQTQLAELSAFIEAQKQAEELKKKAEAEALQNFLEQKALEYFDTKEEAFEAVSDGMTIARARGASDIKEFVLSRLEKNQGKKRPVPAAAPEPAHGFSQSLQSEQKQTSQQQSNAVAAISLESLTRYMGPTNPVITKILEKKEG